VLTQLPDVIVYEISGDGIMILNVFHTAQDR
jgi:hypothetical protein